MAYYFNLWNVSENNKHKTRNTVEYIENLEPVDFWNNRQLKQFKEIIQTALEMTTANEMLEFIGYRPDSRPNIYNVINRTE